MNTIQKVGDSMSDPSSLTGSILTWVDKDGQSHSKQLSEGKLNIGRHTQNDIVLDDPTVSRRHATISYEDLRHYLSDQSSRTGTLLNKNLIQPDEPQLLNDEDEIEIGQVTFTFRDPNKTIGKAQYEEALRASTPNPRHYNLSNQNDGLVINLTAGEVRNNGEEVALTPKEFALLALLYQNQDRACTRPEIRRAVWPEREGDDEQAVSDEEIDGLVRRLRQKIEADRANPRYIITVRQVRGYRFKNH